MADSTGETSEFNYAISFLNVLLQLEIKCYEARNYNDIFGWYNALVDMNSHLYSDMSDKEKVKVEAYRLDTYPSVQRNINKRKYGTDFSLYNSLYEWEIFLKEIIKTKGYRGKMKNAMRALEA